MNDKIFRTLSVKWITKKIIKVTAILLGILAALLVIFHFWFIHHAEGLIEDMVASQSGGKVHLKVKKFKFNWFSRHMELRDAEFVSTDTATAPAAYRFAVRRMQLQVKAVLPVIFDKKILMDSLRLIDPHISVTRLRKVQRSSDTDSTLSIPQEMGRVYHSIQDALQILKVDGFVIDNGTFTLVDKTDEKAPPMQVSKLHLRLDNLKVDTSETGLEQKILFSDNVVVQTHHQDIRFPDGRHRLSFRDFKIDVQRRLAEFDSCTVMATPGDSSGNSFRIFFEKLRMTNIDFDTLYHHEIIKADSVYCYNPQIRLDVEINASKPGATPPRLDALLQQLAGDMQLDFVVVENGSFDINTTRNGVPSSFTSRNNNFNLQGLVINSKATRQVTVDGFSMAIRNYENFLKDSAYAIRFDSVHLRDNRISLNEFSYTELINGKTNRLIIPQFELYGLSWDELVFHRQLHAQQATLYNPEIYFDARSLQGNGSKDIFSTLAGVGELVNLNRLNVEQGTIQVILPDRARLTLNGARFSVKGNELTAARQTSAMLEAIENIHFTSGQYQHKNLKANLQDVYYNSQSNTLEAGNLTIKNTELDVQARQVRMGNWWVDETSGLTTMENLSWEEAMVKWIAPDKNRQSKTALSIKNINGKNTTFSGQWKSGHFSVNLDEANAASVLLTAGQAPVMDKLNASGKKLLVMGTGWSVNSTRFDYKDGGNSVLNELRIQAIDGSDSLQLYAPKAELKVAVHELLQQRHYAEAVRLIKPEITSTASATKGMSTLQTDSLHIQVGTIALLQPVLHISRRGDKDTSLLRWLGVNDSNQLVITDLLYRRYERIRLSAGAVALTASDFLYKGINRKSFDAGKGSIHLQIDSVAWREDDLGQGEWKARLRQLSARNFQLDSIGASKATWSVKTAALSDLHISSSLLLNLRELAKQNKNFNLRSFTGFYQDSMHLFTWNNAAYDKSTKVVTLDSFTYRPVLSRDSFIALSRYQTDYLTVQTGKIDIGPFELDEFISDTLIHAGKITIDSLRLNDFRDTRLPREPGVVRPLLVNTIRKIKASVQIDSAILTRSTVHYGELHDKTGMTGTISVNRLSGEITNIKNTPASSTDSLQIRAEAWLQDSLHTRLFVKESYTDSLGGFIMQVQTGPADLRIFNPVLGPLASAHIRSGIVDTMYMEVTGREAFAYGIMQMIYHDLKIAILDNHQPKKGKLKTKLTQFAINTILKNKNRSRKGTVFTERKRDRSAVNYLVKTVMSGITSNAGLRKSKRQSRKYKQAIQDILRQQAE